MNSIEKASELSHLLATRKISSTIRTGMNSSGLSFTMLEIFRSSGFQSDDVIYFIQRAEALSAVKIGVKGTGEIYASFRENA